MEAATLSDPAIEEPAEQPIAAAEIDNSKLFEYSRDVHVGDGAATCPTPEACEEDKHFHAWLCLANAFQVRDIGDKARAAQARKIRALKDDGDGDDERASDGFVTLEAMLDERREDMANVIEEVVQNSVAKQLSVIYREVREEEEFATIDQESEELARQRLLPEEERDADEYAQLLKAQELFGATLEERVRRRTDAEREALGRLPEEDVIDLLRKKLIEEEGRKANINTYYMWLMFIGTRDYADHEKRRFAALQELKNAAPEIVKALRETVHDLEEKTRGGGQGNS